MIPWFPLSYLMKKTMNPNNSKFSWNNEKKSCFRCQYWQCWLRVCYFVVGPLSSISSFWFFIHLQFYWWIHSCPILIVFVLSRGFDSFVLFLLSLMLPSFSSSAVSLILGRNHQRNLIFLCLFSCNVSSFYSSSKSF